MQERRKEDGDGEERGIAREGEERERTWRERGKEGINVVGLLLGFSTRIFHRISHVFARIHPS